MSLPPPGIEYQLAQAIRRAEEREEAFAALLRTQVTVAGKPGEGDSVSLGYLASNTGGPIYPFFTSQYVYWGSVAVRPDFGPENLILPAGALMEMTRGQRLVLNPDGPFNIIFEPDDIDQLLTTGKLPDDRGIAQLADDEVLDQVELEHDTTQINNHPDAIDAMRKRLMDTQLFLLGAPENIDEGMLKAGTQVESVLLTDEQGPICPVFSSAHMVRATVAAIPNLPANTLAMKGEHIVELTGASRFVLNPHSPTPFFFEG